MFVTPDPGCRVGAAHLALTERLVGAALAGGVDAIQLRAKSLAARQLLSLAERCLELCHRHQAVLLINDRLDVALAAGAHGVQLGEAGLPIEAASALRRRAGVALMLGGSVHDHAGVLAARAGGADYLVFGHIYPSRSKPGLPPAGVPKLAAAVETAGGTPVYAIGGITAGKVPELRRTGVAGIAVIGAIAGAADPTAAAAELVSAWQGQA